MVGSGDLWSREGVHREGEREEQRCRHHDPGRREERGERGFGATRGVLVGPPRGGQPEGDHDDAEHRQPRRDEGIGKEVGDRVGQRVHHGCTSLGIARVRSDGGDASLLADP
jgi:hypothetical protein